MRPCRSENPNVVRAYEKYKGRKDSRSSPCRSTATRTAGAKPLSKTNFLWPNHVSDLQGWRNAAAREYGISSIPHTMLIDRDGPSWPPISAAMAWNPAESGLWRNDASCVHLASDLHLGAPDACVDGSQGAGVHPLDAGRRGGSGFAQGKTPPNSIWSGTCSIFGLNTSVLCPRVAFA